MKLIELTPKTIYEDVWFTRCVPYRYIKIVGLFGETICPKLDTPLTL